MVSVPGREGGRLALPRITATSTVQTDTIGVHVAMGSIDGAVLESKSFVQWNYGIEAGLQTC